MLLVIDVGNTNIVLGIFDGKTLVDHWRISTDRLRTTDEYGVLIRNLFYLNNANAEEIDAIIIPPSFRRSCRHWNGCASAILALRL